jgi:hypothetical protein
LRELLSFVEVYWLRESVEGEEGKGVREKEGLKI